MINLLHLALPVINVVHPTMTVLCRRLVSSSYNSMGVASPVWDEFEARGQVQPQTVDDQGNNMNIDVAQKSLNIWIKAELHTVDNQEVADQVVFNDKVWNVITVNNWNRGNGWGNYTVTEDKYVAVDQASSTAAAKKDGLKWE